MKKILILILLFLPNLPVYAFVIDNFDSYQNNINLNQTGNWICPSSTWTTTNTHFLNSPNSVIPQPFLSQCRRETLPNVEGSVSLKIKTTNCGFNPYRREEFSLRVGAVDYPTTLGIHLLADFSNNCQIYHSGFDTIQIVPMNTFDNWTEIWFQWRRGSTHWQFKWGYGNVFQVDWANSNFTISRFPNGFDRVLLHATHGTNGHLFYADDLKEKTFAPPAPAPSEWLNPPDASHLSFVSASETTDSIRFKHQSFCHLQPTLDSFFGSIKRENLDNSQKVIISSFSTFPNRLSCGAPVESAFSIPKTELTESRFFSQVINWQTANELPFSDLTWDYKFVIKFNHQTAGFYDLQGNRLFPLVTDPPLTLLPPVVPQIGFLPSWVVQPVQDAINQVQETFINYLETIKTRFPISWFFSIQEIINNARNVPGQRQYPSLVFAVPNHNFQIDMLPIQSIVNSPNFLNSGVSFTPIISLLRMTLQFMLFIGFAFVVVNRVRAFIYSLSIPA